MRNMKWVDIRIGKHIFTVRCNRCDESGLGVVVAFDVYELHEHPTNFLKRFLEFWKYKQFASGNWIESLSDDGLQERIIDACRRIVESNEKHLDAIQEWENL